MRHLVADRLTSLARTRLRPGAVGRVHSAFAGVVNLHLARARSGPDSGWLSLHLLSPGEPLPSPFAIACPRSLDPRVPGLTRVEPGLEVRVRDDALWLGPVARVDVRDATAVDVEPRMEAGPREPRRWLVRTALARGRGGLLPAAAGVLGLAPAPGDSLSRLATPGLVRLAVATRRGDSTECRRAAVSLLGLGPGLTPSGDDVIVGWLATLWASSTSTMSGTGARGIRGAHRVPGAGPLVHAIRDALLAAAAERTTALSRAFLSAALEGAVAPALGRFVGRPDRAALDALLRIGATSGADSLAGHLLARGFRSRHARPLSCLGRSEVAGGATTRGEIPIGGSR